jgi:pimeloyl-ACP methyl ester carboxylesterase
LAHGEAHLIGHSVGGAAVLRYLTGVRAGSLPAPRVRVRAAVTLDAALSGIAGVWSGARTLTGRGASEGLAGLGAWAKLQEINLITICNERDIWSHRAVDDLPYVGLRLGPPFDLGAQLNGAVHGWVRRMPQIVDALWPDPATGDVSTQPLD